MSPRSPFSLRIFFGWPQKIVLLPSHAASSASITTPHRRCPRPGHAVVEKSSFSARENSTCGLPGSDQRSPCQHKGGRHAV